MLPGMTFTIEPGVSEGSPNIKVLGDNWTAVSPDNSRSAQFEHTVLVTRRGAETLTLPGARGGACGGTCGQYVATPGAEHNRARKAPFRR